MSIVITGSIAVPPRPSGSANPDQFDQAEAMVWLDRCGVEYQGLRDAVQNAKPESIEGRRPP